MQLPQLFTEHMVLQRDLPILVWGWADAGEHVTVTLAGQTATGVTDADGAWRVTLPALPAGGPHTLSVQGATDTTTVTDVLIGEVWLCSGQSNMEWPVSLASDAEAEMANADDPQLRMFNIPHTAMYDPAQDTPGAAWAVTSPSTVGVFSAVGYFFARALRRQLQVPVGMIHTSWGGTPAEAWTSREALAAEPEIAELLQPLDGLRISASEEMLTAQERWNTQMQRVMPALTDTVRAWAVPACDDSAWPQMTLPTIWQDAGIPENGVLLFRVSVDLPASWAGKSLTLSLGAIDKSDVTFFNGEEVGRCLFSENPGSWCTPRQYDVPGHLVRAGENVIAVRVFSHIFGGGFGSQAEAMYLCADGETPIPLAGPWRYQIEELYGNFSQLCLFMPTTLYNAMIHPLIPYAIRGAIWYQGESNANRYAQYRTLFPALIRDWRTRWAQGDFPFYFVQLTNYLARHAGPTDSDWARLREAQTATLALPNTGMAVTIDVGDAEDIHPLNKQDVGARLAQLALTNTYGHTGVPAGPLFTSASVEGNALRVHFDQVGGGLAVHGDQLTGFAIAGEDRQFVWANARIDGDTVLVSSPAVPVPVAVRYAWADNPACNLYNADGFPASPFRTDSWAQDEAPVATA